MFRTLSDHRFLFTIGMLAIPLLLGLPAEGKDTFPARIPNGAVFTCFTCHTTSIPNRNSFGDAFRNANRTWTAALAAMDSDGDGHTNGQELLDPSGTWTQGSANPGNPNDVTNPGSADVFAQPTATNTAVPQSTATATNTAAPQATATPTNTSSVSQPTATPTHTSVAPQATATPTHTAEPQATGTPTSTPPVGEPTATRTPGGGGEDDTEITGSLSGIDTVNRTFLLEGVLIRVDSETVIKDDDNELISFEDLQNGDTVEVEGTEQEDGSVLAKKVKIEDRHEEGEPCDHEFTGSVTEVDPSLGTLVIEGQTVLTDDMTVFLGHRNTPATFADFGVGALVEVKGTLQTGGEVLACRLKLEDDEHETCENEFTGTISEIDLGLGLLVVNGQLVSTDDMTVVLGHENQPISLSDLSVGEVVEIKGTPQTDGSILACRIKSENEMEDCEKEFKGVVSEINEASQTLVVGRVLLRVGSSTEILDHDRNPISLADLAIGDLAEVKYCPTSGVPPLAQRIKLEKREGHEHECEVEVEGAISDIDLGMTTMVVNGTFIHATGASVRDDHGGPIAFSDLAIGDIVKVKGCLNPDSTVQATSIRRKGESESNCESKVRGHLTLIDLDTMTVTVGLVMIQVNDQTVIRDDRSGATLTLADLMLGSSVKVDFCARTGVPIATRIKVKDSEDYDLDEDGEYEEDDMLEIIREVEHEGLNLDLTGDNRTGGDDVITFSRKWKGTRP